MTERIQKLLANAGVGSRRQIETWIKEGRVTVNKQPATIGMPLTGNEHVEIDGRPVRITVDLPPCRVLVLNKVEGTVCSRSDPEGRDTVFQALPSLQQGRWINVGRLDINTSGLLLFTNDGELANRLMHPRYELLREYAMRVRGDVDALVIQRLTQGVELEDGPARFESVRDAGGSGSNHWYHVTLREGRNREVRRLCEAVGLTVSRLKRIAYGPVKLDKALRVGQWLELGPAEIQILRQSVGLPYTEKADAKRPATRREVTPKGSARSHGRQATERSRTDSDRPRRESSSKPGRAGKPAGPGNRSGNRSATKPSGSPSRRRGPQH